MSSVLSEDTNAELMNGKTQHFEAGSGTETAETGRESDVSNIHIDSDSDGDGVSEATVSDSDSGSISNSKRDFHFDLEAGNRNSNCNQVLDDMGNGQDSQSGKEEEVDVHVLRHDHETLDIKSISNEAETETMIKKKKSTMTNVNKTGTQKQNRCLIISCVVGGLFTLSLCFLTTLIFCCLCSSNSQKVKSSIQSEKSQGSKSKLKGQGKPQNNYEKTSRTNQKRMYKYDDVLRMYKYNSTKPNATAIATATGNKHKANINKGKRRPMEQQQIEKNNNKKVKVKSETETAPKIRFSRIAKSTKIKKTSPIRITFITPEQNLKKQDGKTKSRKKQTKQVNTDRNTKSTNSGKSHDIDGKSGKNEIADADTGSNIVEQLEVKPEIQNANEQSVIDTDSISTEQDRENQYPGNNNNNAENPIVIVKSAKKTDNSEASKTDDVDTAKKTEDLKLNHEITELENQIQTIENKKQTILSKEIEKVEIKLETYKSEVSKLQISYHFIKEDAFEDSTKKKHWYWEEEKNIIPFDLLLGKNSSEDSRIKAENLMRKAEDLFNPEKLKSRGLQSYPDIYYEVKGHEKQHINYGYLRTKMTNQQFYQECLIEFQKHGHLSIYGWPEGKLEHINKYDYQPYFDYDDEQNYKAFKQEWDFGVLPGDLEAGDKSVTNQYYNALLEQDDLCKIDGGKDSDEVKLHKQRNSLVVKLWLLVWEAIKKQLNADEEVQGLLKAKQDLDSQQKSWKDELEKLKAQLQNVDKEIVTKQDQLKKLKQNQKLQQQL